MSNAARDTGVVPGARATPTATPPPVAGPGLSGRAVEPPDTVNAMSVFDSLVIRPQPRTASADLSAARAERLYLDAQRTGTRVA